MKVNQIKQTSNEVWQPPPPFAYKLNFDTVVFLGLEKFGIGAIIRNKKGEVMVAMFAFRLKTDNSEEDELLTAEDLWSLLWMLGLQA